MSNYITTIKDKQNNAYPIYDERLKQGGTKAFWYKEYYYDPVQEAITLKLIKSDCTEASNSDLSNLSEGDLVSFKAEFSCSFIGTIVSKNAPTIVIQMFDGQGMEQRNNWVPEYLGYDGTTNNDWVQVFTNGDYLKTSADSDEAQISPNSDGSDAETVKKYDLSYIWFPEKPYIQGDIEIGESAIAVDGNYANEIYSFAEGGNTVADGRYSHAEGYGTQAAYSSHAEGYLTKAYGVYSHAEGINTKASGVVSHSEGNLTTSNGAQSHAEGFQTIARGVSSHAEGHNTNASKDYAHSEGYQTTASGNASHSEGSGTVASGNKSHSEGTGTIASKENQHVQGRYNENLGATYVDIVGWGDNSSNKKNIYVLDTSGNLYIRGELYIKASNDACTQGTRFPAPPATGNYVLKSSNGVMSWELDS